MRFLYEFGGFEKWVIALFLIFYILYVVRIVKIGKKLNMSTISLLVKLSLRTAFMVLLVLALLGPSEGETKQEIRSIGKDIMICVDLSKSMDAFDIQPSRLEKVKYEMKKVAEAFHADRLGVVIFSAEAFMQCPLTHDKNALTLFIETMNTNLVPGGGTDFSPPLKLALKKLQDDKKPSEKTRSKIIILISDGEDFGDDTGEIVNEIEENGIKLFTLGVGTDAGSRIQDGRGYKTDRDGKPVISKLNSQALRTLARKTDGQYFEINASRNDVNKLINTIGKIEGQVREARFVDVSSNQYYYFLLPALLILLVDVLFSVKTIRI